MKNLTFLLFVFASFFIANTSSAQNIGGVINSYSSVSVFNGTCSNQITASNTFGFSVDDYVLIIQMRGATISTANNATYGNVTSLNSAGLYEVARIKAIEGNQVFFYANLLNTYNVAGSVQMVSIPIYNGATITSTLTAPQWNGATGGVLALVDTGTLTMNANIDVSERGFRGGNVTETGSSSCSPFFGNSSAYEYSVGSVSGKDKGEGIGGTYGLHGRGAAANGGGGGNDHKTGGGGGGNTASGGQGSQHDDPNPFFVACDGSFPGIGGKGTAYTITQRAMLGGGGGGGANANGGSQPDGGNGGGIVMLMANNLVTNSNRVLANGEDGATGIGNGAAGGGAGGTIAIGISSQVGVLRMNAIGGDGGNSNSGIAGGRVRCWGKGGGGAGGRIFSNHGLVGAITIINFAGGPPGVEVNASSSCTGSSSNAAGGGAGNSNTSTIFDLLSLTNPTLLTDVLSFPLQPQNQTVCLGGIATIALAANSAMSNPINYQWQLNNGTGWTDLNPSTTYINPFSSVLTISPVTAAMQMDSFRCIIETPCKEDMDTSNVIILIVNGTSSFDAVNDVLTTSTDSITCDVSGTGWRYFYDEDGELLLGIDPNGENLGQVKMKVVVGDNGPFGTDLGCAAGSGGEYHLERYWDITVQNQPTNTCFVRFFYNQTELDAFQTLTQSQSANYIACWGQVTSESDLMMTVTHDGGVLETLTPAFAPGLTTGRLATLALDSFSNGKLHSNGGIEANNPLPVTYLSFDARYNNGNVNLDWTTATEINNAGFELQRSIDGVSFEVLDWIVGNGNATEINDYTYVDNEIGSNPVYYYRLNQVDFDGKSEFSVVKSVKVPTRKTVDVRELMPNPTTGNSVLLVTSKSNQDYQLKVSDMQGKTFTQLKGKLSSGQNEILLEGRDIPAGTYLVQLQVEGEMYYKKWVLIK